jgi:hypothetical protein
LAEQRFGICVAAAGAANKQTGESGMNETYNDHLSDLILAGQIARIVKRDRSEVLKALRTEPFLRRLALRRRQQRMPGVSDEEAERLAREDGEGDDDGWRLELRRRKQHEAHMDESLRAVTIAKCMVEQGRPLLSEHELTKAITDYAMLSRRANETPEAAFTRVFEGNDSTGLMFRKAVAVAKGYPIARNGESDQAGGDELDEVTGGRDGEALARLNELAERERKDGESFAAAFERVYQRERGLAKAERRHAYAKLRGAA